MAKRRLFGSKGPLIYATIVSLICVMSASISTFAWFQAEANVQVQTTSTSANISVTKPDNVNAYFYYSDNNGVNGYASSTVNTFSSASTTLPAITAFWPGFKATYKVKASGRTSLTLSLKSFTSTPNNSRHLLEINPQTEQLDDLGTKISAAYGVHIYQKTYSAESDAAYLSWVDTIDTDSEASTNNVFGYASDPTISSCEIATASQQDKTGWLYFYFTVAFDDNDSSCYIECSDAAGTPSPTDNPNAATRYFKQGSKANGGNSNCFMGLTFVMDTINLE